MIKIKNGVLKLEKNQFDYVQFGCGDRSLVVIPGLGDGIVTVKNKALLGVFMFHDYVRRFKITIISRKNNLEEGATTFTMARDQAEAMKALGIDQAEVVGISEGGMIAQHLAADRCLTSASPPSRKTPIPAWLRMSWLCSSISWACSSRRWRDRP